MIAVFTLISLGLLLSVTWFAATAASAAAQRGLQVAQTPGGTETEAGQVAGRLAASSRIVTDVDVAVTGDPETVTVQVRARTVLGGSVSRTSTGPRLRFIPQTGP
jgi:hypothetical protein